MFKKILAILFVLALIFGISKLSSAMMFGSHSKQDQTAEIESSGYTQTHTDVVTQSTAKEPVNVGNKICPVSGDKINEETKATYEYEGKIYNFCCPMCIEEFKKDPGKYIKKVEEELQQRAEKKEDMSDSRAGEGTHKH